MKNIKKLAESLKKIMLSDKTSLVSDDDVWNKDNFDRLWLAFKENEKAEAGTFVAKLALQLQESNKLVKELKALTDVDKEMLLRLSIELLGVYYAYPTNISIETKVNTIDSLITEFYSSADSSDKKVLANNFSNIVDAFNDGGVGSGGMGYNTNRQSEFSFLIEIFKNWFNEELNSRRETLASNEKFQNWLDILKGDKRNPQSRHLILYYLYPDYYEPIVSTGQKRSIESAFGALIEDAIYEDIEDPIDQKIQLIRLKLGEIRGRKTNFYDSDLERMWNKKFTTSLDLDIEDLLYKKQIVLYGPPGTGKTYTANELAKDLINHQLIKKYKSEIFEKDNQAHLNKCLSENIFRLQLHPAYSYEEFIRGLQIINGDTSYRDGFLLKKLDKVQESDDPFVLILDEMNRVDLSRLFGECFSALENRDKRIDLISGDLKDGHKNYIMIPSNLFIIGTMNLIDHSVEQLDFALRRRFLWQHSDYDEEALLNIFEEKWSSYQNEKNGFLNWPSVFPEFDRLADAANNLNSQIEKEGELGKGFKLGHVFFVDALYFLVSGGKFKPAKIKNSFFKENNEPQEPVNKLWKLSLSPLLTEYLSGLDEKTQKDILSRLEKSFRPRK